MKKILISIILLLNITGTVYGQEESPTITNIEIVDEDQKDDETNNKCPIETAFEGSDSEVSIAVLRDFRDDHLMKTRVGQGFVDLYYKNSSAIASLIADNEFLKSGVRTIVAPVVAVISLL